MGYTTYISWTTAGDTKSGVPEKEIRPLTSANPPPTRGQMIGKSFYCDGCPETEEALALAAGRWRIRTIVNVNEFRCVRLTGPKDITVDNFDIGYVMKTYQSELSDNRARGVFETVTGKRKR